MEKLYQGFRKKKMGCNKNGKEITFREAIDYRYRNEGQKAIDKDKKERIKEMAEQKISEK